MMPIKKILRNVYEKYCEQGQVLSGAAARTGDLKEE